jgi:RNA polymerase sigma-70 factor (ECF subfamily)
LAGDPVEDRELVERCLLKDQKGYQLLLDRYRRPVYGIVRRMVANDEEAQDLAQEAFIRAFRNLEQFDRNRSFSNWLFRIATNLCIDHHRKRKIKTVPLVRTDRDGEEQREMDAPDTGDTPAEEYSDRERGRRLSEVIESLPPLYRVVIQLRHIESRSYDEIAEILELPLGTVKARIHRAHRLLREKLVRRDYDWTPES